jgi:transcriptional regulator with XRE-family HTH domain
MAKTVYFPVINLKGTGSNIERCRRKAGLSVRDLQTYFGFEYPQAIYKWQHGECLPTVDNLLALSRILGVRMEDLLVYEDQEVFPSIRDAVKGAEPYAACEDVMKWPA